MSNEHYDSAPDTRKHIARVQELITQATNNLTARAAHHDDSKLCEPEKSGYDELGKALHGTTYGTPEYQAVMRDSRVKDVINHHVTTNDHHIQANVGGINGMSLLSVLEMCCDWKAASERGGGVSFADGLAMNKERYGISDQLHAILENTAREMGWL